MYGRTSGLARRLKTSVNDVFAASQGEDGPLTMTTSPPDVLQGPLDVFRDAVLRAVFLSGGGERGGGAKLAFRWGSHDATLRRDNFRSRRSSGCRCLGAETSRTAARRSFSERATSRFGDSVGYSLGNRENESRTRGRDQICSLHHARNMAGDTGKTHHPSHVFGGAPNYKWGDARSQRSCCRRTPHVCDRHRVYERGENTRTQARYFVGAASPRNVQRFALYISRGSGAGGVSTLIASTLACQRPPGMLPSDGRTFHPGEFPIPHLVSLTLSSPRHRMNRSNSAADRHLCRLPLTPRLQNLAMTLTPPSSRLIWARRDSRGPRARARSERDHHLYGRWAARPSPFARTWWSGS